MKVAVITMVYNEKINLPIWMSYYGNMFGSENLYIIDHGSNDGSVDSIGEASRIKLPRGVYENESRAQMISRFHSSLLSYYDVVIYTDCDEMIVADPEYFKDLKEYLENEEFKHLTLVGLNIIHNSVTEEDIDWTAPILAQRKFCQFVSPMCKTLISKAPIIWSPGFHGSSFFPNVDQRLYLFHLKRADLKTNLERLELTRKINWKSDNLGLHQRSSDEEMIKLFESYTRYSVTDDFSFSQEISEFISETKLDSKGIYSCKDIRGKRMVTIPERFVGIL